MFSLRRSIRIKLLVGFFLVAFVPLSVMTVLYFSTLYSTLRDSAEMELQVGAQQTRSQLRNFFQENINNLRSQSQFPDFIDYLQADVATRGETEARLSIILKSFGRTEYQSHIQTYLLLDSTGRVIYDQGQRDVGLNLSNEEFFVRTMAQGFPQVIIDQQDGPQPTIYFSVPIWDEAYQGQPIGVLGLRYNMSVLRALIEDAVQMAGPQSFAILMDDSGKVLAWGDQPEYPNINVDLGYVENKHGVGSIYLDGELYTMSYSALPNAPLHVLYVEPESAITEYVFSNVTLVLLVSFIVLVLTFGGALFVGNQVSRPVKELTRIAGELSNGQLDARVNLNLEDEFGILGNTFNQMADQVQAELRQVRAAEERYRELSESLEQKVNQRTEELQTANRELESFSYSVSHDLRAPLRAIDGYSRILMDHSDQLDDEAKGYLGKLRNGAAQMGLLIDGLLALSRLGRQNLERRESSPTEVEELVRRVVQEVHHDAPERQVEWHIDHLPGCEMDVTLMRQVFANLLGNAFKYTRGRSPAVIEVGFDQKAFFVRDNGVGFDMRYSNKLFGVFQRLHSSEEFEGTGIGLVTVKRIIEKHGGRIWVESAVGRGTTFYFTLGCAEN